MIHRRGIVDLRRGARKFGRRLARDKGRAVLDPFVYTAFGRNGWMVPNQYWTPGVLAPMAVMGRYYMYYGYDFTPPRSLGNLCAGLMRDELMLDNLGFCRFHRAWAQDMIPDHHRVALRAQRPPAAGSDDTVERMDVPQRRQLLGVAAVRRLTSTRFSQRKRDVEKENRPELHRVDSNALTRTSTTRRSPSGTKSTAA